MGVKQHCDELERQGHVDTWRRPKPVGRPEMIYRLTSKHRLFPSTTNATTIEILQAANRLMDTPPGEIAVFRLCFKGGELHAEIAGKDSSGTGRNAG